MADPRVRRADTEQVIHTPIARPAAVRPDTAMSYGSSATQFSRTTYSSVAPTLYNRQVENSSDEEDPTPIRSGNPGGRVGHLRTISENPPAPKMQMPNVNQYIPPSNPPPNDHFALKLRNLLCDDSYEKYITWNADGVGFKLRNHPNFAPTLYTVFGNGDGYYVHIRKQLEQNGFQVRVTERRTSGHTGEEYEVYDCRRPGFTQDVVIKEVPITKVERLTIKPEVTREMPRELKVERRFESAPPPSKPEVLPQRQQQQQQPSMPKPQTRPHSNSNSNTNNNLDYVKLCRILRERNQDLSNVIDERENDYRILFNTVQEIIMTNPGFKEPFLDALTRHKQNNHYIPVSARRNLSDSDSDDEMSQDYDD